MLDTLSESSIEAGPHSPHKREFSEAFDEDIDMKDNQLFRNSKPEHVLRAFLAFLPSSERYASTSSPAPSDVELPSQYGSCG
ncbi:uncharacterized protein LAESUDRAFT_728129 [Laetiporus sulphureus 93-53]|uniref:Uncharacterized protein n=1 Tax=Laetiporus sulphureus 93-53 TaxID=1314785 RepID=A0A165D891_9APHY|nr:uncharacterized protein LAESUDRAFT_728129 [Laetiporus sulphureus 93-53]KZT04314.1 hypothetical protein LAESUDRAFT_728129 [Laetiporus sulphureus 93-53]